MNRKRSCVFEFYVSLKQRICRFANYSPRRWEIFVNLLSRSFVFCGFFFSRNREIEEKLNVQYSSDYPARKREERIERKRFEGIIGEERDGISNLDPGNPIFFLEREVDKAFAGDVRFYRLSTERIGNGKWNRRGTFGEQFKEYRERPRSVLKFHNTTVRSNQSALIEKSSFFCANRMTKFDQSSRWHPSQLHLRVLISHVFWDSDSENWISNVPQCRVESSLANFER